MMNIKRFWVLPCLFLAGVVITGWYYNRYQTLQTSLNNSPLPLHKIQATDKSISLDGQSLVFYNVQSSEYPEFHARRIQIQDSPAVFRLRLNGLTGSVLSHLKQLPSGQIQYDLNQYNLQQDFLKQPLLTLGILGYDNILFDVSARIKQTAPNQILLDFMFIEKGRIKLHLQGKFNPNQAADSVLYAVKGRTIPFQILFLDPKWKQQLDTYALTKNSEFLVDTVPISFRF